MTELKGRFFWILGLIAVIWAVQGVNMATGYALNPALGLDPRDLSGLPGIVAMPFLHASVPHAMTNTGSIFVLGGLAGAVARERFIGVTLSIILGGGVLVWLLARDAIHVGASGLTFGWFGFLLVRGVVERSLVAMVASAGVAVIYGAMIWGVLPGDRDVSWESHLYGAIAGGIVAIRLPVLYRRRS